MLVTLVPEEPRRRVAVDDVARARTGTDVVSEAGAGGDDEIEAGEIDPAEGAAEQREQLPERGGIATEALEARRTDVGGGELLEGGIGVVEGREDGRAREHPMQGEGDFLGAARVDEVVVDDRDPQVAGSAA